MTRKKKLLEKQKEGKKRLRRVGNVELSQEVAGRGGHVGGEGGRGGVGGRGWARVGGREHWERRTQGRAEADEGKSEVRLCMLVRLRMLV